MLLDNVIIQLKQHTVFNLMDTRLHLNVQLIWVLSESGWLNTFEISVQ